MVDTPVCHIIRSIVATDTRIGKETWMHAGNINITSERCMLCRSGSSRSPWPARTCALGQATFSREIGDLRRSKWICVEGTVVKDRCDGLGPRIGLEKWTCKSREVTMRRDVTVANNFSHHLIVAKENHTDRCDGYKIKQPKVGPISLAEVQLCIFATLYHLTENCSLGKKIKRL